MLIILLLVVGVYSQTLVTKVYPTSTCYRSHSKQIIKQSDKLLQLLIENPLICPTSRDEYFRMEAKQAVFHKPMHNDFQRGQLNTRNEHQLEGRYKRTSTWNSPAGLPTGTVITYCSTSSCCTPKKTVRPNGIYYNLCRECVHQVQLPSSYSPRDHTHVTCQDTDYSETCFTGEGGCVTNMVTKTVQNNGNSVSFTFGHSCSCEIRTDSIFADYI